MQSIKIKNRLFLSIADRMMQLRSGETMDDFMLSMLLNSRLRDWHRDNAMRLKTLSERINKLRKEFFVYEQGMEMVNGKEVDKEQIKMETKPSIPAFPARYEKKIITPKGWFTKEVSEQIEVSPASPEKTFQPEPVCLEGKTLAGYNEEYNKILEEENTLVF